MELNSTYIDLGATAKDAEGNELMPDIIENTVDTEIVGEYYVTWSAHDSQMNTASTTRVVIVFDPYQTQIDADTDAQIDADTDTRMDADTDTQIDADTDTQIDADTDARIDADTNATTTGEV